MEQNEIEINGKKYVLKSSIKETKLAAPNKNMPYVIVRTYSAGVFAGYIGKRIGGEAKVYNARRIYYWDGAATLSQLSQNGTTKPENCKFPCEVPFVELINIIEVLPCTEKAKISIQGVKVWQQ